eukprot:6364434-Prymnesium_polylepis.1
MCALFRLNSNVVMYRSAEGEEYGSIQPYNTRKAMVSNGLGTYSRGMKVAQPPESGNPHDHPPHVDRRRTMVATGTPERPVLDRVKQLTRGVFH